MPTTVLHVERVDKSRYTGRLVAYDDYLVTGVEVGAHTVQFHTTSEWLASICQRARELERPASIDWREGRIGKHIVGVSILAREAVA